MHIFNHPYNFLINKFDRHFSLILLVIYYKKFDRLLRRKLFVFSKTIIKIKWIVLVPLLYTTSVGNYCGYIWHKINNSNQMDIQPTSNFQRSTMFIEVMMTSHINIKNHQNLNLAFGERKMILKVIFQAIWKDKSHLFAVKTQLPKCAFNFRVFS